MNRLEQLVIEFYERFASGGQSLDEYGAFAIACFEEVKETHDREMGEAFSRGSSLSSQKKKAEATA